MKLFSEKLLMKKATELLTFTIEPTPSDALVVLTATGYTQVGNSISVPYNTSVDWSVSKSGYVSQNGTQVITSTTTRTVTLEEVSGTPLYVGCTFYRKNAFNSAQHYSNDLLNWTQNTSFPISSSSAYSMIKFKKKFIAKYGSTAYYTEDGQNWNTFTLPSTQGGSLTVCNEKLYWSAIDGTNFSCYVTEDGNNWGRLYSLPTGSMGYNSLPFFVGNKYFIGNYYSLDGYSWYKTNLPDGIPTPSISFANDIYFAIGGASSGVQNLYKSANGINWEQIINSNIPRIESVVSNDQLHSGLAENIHIRCTLYGGSKYGILIYDGINFQYIEESTSFKEIVGVINGEFIILIADGSYLMKYDKQLNQLVAVTSNKFNPPASSQEYFQRISYKNGYYFQDYTGISSISQDSTRTSYYSSDFISWSQVQGNIMQIEYGELDV